MIFVEMLFLILTQVGIRELSFEYTSINTAVLIFIIIDMFTNLIIYRHFKIASLYINFEGYTQNIGKSLWNSVWFFDRMHDRTREEFIIFILFVLFTLCKIIFGTTIHSIKCIHYECFNSEPLYMLVLINIYLFFAIVAFPLFCCIFYCGFYLTKLLCPEVLDLAERVKLYNRPDTNRFLDLDNDVLDIESQNTIIDDSNKNKIYVLTYMTICNIRKHDELSQCSICTLQFKSNSVVKPLKICGHYFHQNCIKKWLQNHKTCPICIRYV
jgi:hypothetical protein